MSQVRKSLISHVLEEIIFGVLVENVCFCTNNDLKLFCLLVLFWFFVCSCCKWIGHALQKDIQSITRKAQERQRWRALLLPYKSLGVTINDDDNDILVTLSAGHWQTRL